MQALKPIDPDVSLFAVLREQYVRPIYSPQLKRACPPFPIFSYRTFLILCYIVNAHYAFNGQFLELPRYDLIRDSHKSRVRFYHEVSLVVLGLLEELLSLNFLVEPSPHLVVLVMKRTRGIYQ